MICRLCFRLNFFLCKISQSFFCVASVPTFVLERHARYLWVHWAFNHKYTWWDRRLHLDVVSHLLIRPGKTFARRCVTIQDGSDIHLPCWEQRRRRHCSQQGTYTPLSSRLEKRFVRKRSLSGKQCLRSNNKYPKGEDVASLNVSWTALTFPG